MKYEIQHIYICNNILITTSEKAPLLLAFNNTFCSKDNNENLHVIHFEYSFKDFGNTSA